MAKTGGLADVLGALCRYLHGHGHEIRAFLPFYSTLETRETEIAPVGGLHDVPLALGAHHYRFSVLTARPSRSSLPIYLIDCPALYERSSIYTSGADEHLRFLLLTRAAIESCQRLGFAPHIFHCHDWHASFTPLYLRSIYAWDRLFAATKTVLTIHNVGYQGVMPAQKMADLGLGDAGSMLYQPDLAQGRINALRHGILHAHALTTVSPTHAQEIRTAQYGMGLDDSLRQRADALTGILNGIDDEEWNPATDRHLPHHFTARNLAGKRKLKQALLERFALQPTGTGAADAPLIGIVSRMARQKGFELLFEPLPRLLAERDFRMVIIGNGDARYGEFFLGLQRRFPTRLALHRGYHEELAHLVEAAGDIFLMPSLYEPCGLNQMYSLRYGTVPIVRRTGGLADSVQHFDPATGTGTGVVFNDYDSAAVTWALDTAFEWYRDKALWKRLMRNGMAQDFSWNKQGARYVQLYRRLVGV